VETTRRRRRAADIGQRRDMVVRFVVEVSGWASAIIFVRLASD